MPTPVYALRLDKKTQTDLSELAMIYGLPNGRAFAREILQTMISGDSARIAAFNKRLLIGMGEQLALQWNAPLKAIQDAEAQAVVELAKMEVAKPKKKRGRRAKRP